MNFKLALIVLNIFFIYCTLQSQTIQLVFSPNPSPYISDWQSRTETATLIISNPTTEDISVKIKTELFNGQGALIANTVDSKMPVLIVPPGVNQYNAEDMFPIHALKYQGSLERTTAQTGRIPDDNYRFCVSLIDPQTGAPVGPSGSVCRMFNILAYQAPTLITPYNDEFIPEKDIHGIVFRWTPVTPPPKTIVTYRLQVFEVLEGQENMMALVNNQPIVEKDFKGVLQSQWPVEFALPETGRTYVWTITPLDDEERKIVDGHGFAEPFIFRVGLILRTQEEETGVASVGDTIYAGEDGEFKVVVSEITLESDGTLSGKGDVFVEWLYANVAVEFTKIKIDAPRRLTHGGITAQINDNSDGSWSGYPIAYAQSFASTPLGTGISEWGITLANNIVNNTIDWANSLRPGKPPIKYKMSLSTDVIPAESLKMPFGLVFPFQGTNQKLVITEMVLNPDESKINLLTSLKFNKSGTEYKLGFAGKNFIIHKNNVEFTSGRIEMVEDLLVPNLTSDPKMEFKFLKGTQNNGCYVEWSNNGIEDLGIALEIAFSRDWLLPIPSTSPTQKVKATISGNGTSIDDLLLTGNLPNCEIVGTNGLKIEASNISLDLSDSRNLQDITFPANYPGSTDVTWRGFYMKTFGITMPESWKTGSNTMPPSLTAVNLIIDDLGITTKVRALNILDLQSGRVSDLSASLDTVEVSILHSSLQSASVKGELVLPISEVTAQNTLKYRATFSQASTGGTFQIVIVPYKSIEASIMKGSMMLSPTSNLTATLSPGTISAAITLNGVFTWNNPDLSTSQSTSTGNSQPTRPGGIKGIRIELAFENVSFNYTRNTTAQTNDLAFNLGNWSFASPQKFIANLPVSFSNIRYKSLPSSNTSGSKSLLNGAIMFDVVANLTEEIGGSTTLGVAFGIDFSMNPISIKPKFHGVFIEKITVHADLSAVKVDGSLTFYDNDPVYGEGFEATLEVTFNAVSLKVSALAQFGSTTYLNNGDYYRYWRVEADVILPVGIPFLTGVGFYGFGGGAFFNMEPDSVPSLANPGNAKYVFTPKKSALGFMVKATIGTMPKFETFNADVSLLAAFSTSSGITQISFLGNFWLTAGLDERPQAKIMGSVYVGYNFPDKIFNMMAAVKINIPPAIITPQPAGVGFVMNINGRTNKWYFIAGTPTNTNIVRVFGIDLYSYFMFGNDIPTPNGFTQRFVNNYHGATGHYPNNSNVGNGGVGVNTSNGKGIATGVGIEFTKYISQELFDGACRTWSIGGNILAGAELNLALMHQTGCVGINGYRASGNVGLYGSVYATIHGAGRNGCGDKTYNLFKIQAGAWLEGKFPNPEYLAGSISANISLFNGLCECTYYGSFEKGTNCTGTETVTTNAAQEDEADSLKNKLIQYIAPSSQYNFPQKSPINVKYSLVPEQIFDVAENQGDGTIKNRTFMLEAVTILEIKQPNGSWLKSNLYSAVNSLGEYQYYRLNANELLKVAANYKQLAYNNVQLANANIQAGNQLSASSPQSSLDPLFIANYNIALACFKQAENNVEMAQNNSEFTLPNNYNTAQANLTLALQKLQSASAMMGNMGRGDPTFAALIYLLQASLQLAQGNSGVALANWQLAQTNANIGNDSPGAILASAPVSQVLSPSILVNTSSGNTLVNQNGLITMQNLFSTLPPPPVPNYPNPTPAPVNHLVADTDYRFTVTATLKELDMGWKTAVTRQGGQAITETKIYHFRTGGMPIANASAATSRG